MYICKIIPHIQKGIVFNLVNIVMVSSMNPFFTTPQDWKYKVNGWVQPSPYYRWLAAI